MNKDELSINLRKYKKNIASLSLKRRRLTRLMNELAELKQEKTETSITSRLGINNDIRSKNQVGNKVENAVVNKFTRIEELEDEIFYLKCQINNLEDIVEDTRIRFESLSYKKKKIIEAYFFEGQTMEEIGNILYFQLFKQTRNQKTIKKIIESALNEMLKI